MLTRPPTTISKLNFLCSREAKALRQNVYKKIERGIQWQMGATC